MKKLIVNFPNLDSLVGANNWRWVSTQLALTNSIELVHSENADTMLVTLEWAKTNNLNVGAKRLIISDLLNYDDCNNQDWIDVINSCQREVICLTNNQKLVDVLDCKVIVYDFLFNRTKLYYFDTEKAKSNANNLWYYTDSYTLNSVNDKQIIKHFVSLTRRIFGIREQFVDYLIENFVERGYIGCLTKNKFIPGDDTSKFMRYNPIPNQIYNNTFASIYTESTFSSNTIFHATEKTFEPLLKGNYILPFSNPNFVENLKSTYGFIFPSIIDYSYDTELDSTRRFDKFLNSINSFCNLSIDDVIDSYDQNIAKHNRQIFIDRPYDQSILELL
jgi:hypothetical protein